ncbi:MAG: LysR substrate-binding domain-containing protein [Bermanella sp.]
MAINLRSVDLNLLTVFAAVMEHGKLSGAAEHLGMSQPAVSNAVARLRLTFHDELFIRSRHGMLPTQRARELIAPVCQALEIVQNALNPENSFDPNQSNRIFKLAIGDYGELILLPALLSIFSQFKGDLQIQTYPEVNNESFDLVKQGQIDFYFDYKPPVEEQLDYCQIGEEEVVVIARKNHPIFKTQLSHDDYLNAKHIILKFHHSSLTMLEDFLRINKRIPRKVMAEVRQYVAIPGLITQTDCIATVPRKMAEYYAQREAIKIFPFPFEIEKTKTFMIWHKAMNQDQGHLWLKHKILELIKLANLSKT